MKFCLVIIPRTELAVKIITSIAPCVFLVIIPRTELAVKIITLKISLLNRVQNTIIIAPRKI
ncbi:hypothetical protein seszw270S_add [Salmonella phage seszw]|nr:hypothetical protein seszw270S_add [Salmonella phage seszw]